MPNQITEHRTVRLRISNKELASILLHQYNIKVAGIERIFLIELEQDEQFDDVLITFNSVYMENNDI